MPAYIVPIAVYQATAIAGGYGTGREVVQFFSSYGPYEALLGLLAAALLLVVVTAFSFEFARKFKVYDYRSFIKELIGPLWIVFEGLYILLFLIVLAIVASAASNIMQTQFGIPELLGMGVMMSIIAFLLFWGRSVVERSLVVITGLLLVAFIYYFVAVFLVDGEQILEQLRVSSVEDFAWLTPALKFGMYSAVTAAIILFSTSGIETRKEALISGGLCGIIIMLPGLLFHISFLGRFSEVIEEPLPVYFMIGQINAPYLLTIYLVAMFGTFLGTGLGFLQAVSERLDNWAISARGAPLARTTHVAVALIGLCISVGLGQFGIIDLIAKGYGTMAWGFLIVFIIPLLTVGIYRIFSSSSSNVMSGSRVCEP